MKKSLLLAMSFMLTTLGAMAQWVEPDITALETEDMATDGTAQFLLNKDAKGFFGGGNDWNTRASVSPSVGDSVKFTVLYGSESATYNFCDYPIVAKKNKWLYVSCNYDENKNHWVDASNATESASYPGTDKWQFSKNDDGSYKFWNVSELTNIPEFVEETGFGYMGVAEKFEGKTGNTRVYLLDLLSTYTYTDESGEEQTGSTYEGEFWSDWYFVSPEVYDEYHKARVVYDAAVNLKTTIDKTETAYEGINLTDVYTIYNNTSSTVEELDSARTKLIPVAIKNFYKEQMKSATAENPYDVSGMIVNATFDTVGDFTGWSSGFGAGGTTSTNAEIYGKTFDVYQYITGMPEGIYMVACNGYTRYQNADADYNAWKNGVVSETKIYLKSKTRGQFFTPVMHVSQGGSVDEAIGSGSTAQVTYEEEDGTHILYTPNTMAAANDYFHDGTNRYRNEAFGPSADDSLQIGVFNNKATGSCWSIFDDFELKYYGNGDDAYRLWATNVITANAIDFDNYEYVGTPEKDYYNNVVAEIKAATTAEEVSAAILKMDLAVDTTFSSINAYNAYVTQLGVIREYMSTATISGDDVDFLSDYIDEMNVEEPGTYPNGTAAYILENTELSTAGITAELAYMNELYNTALANGMSEGTDVSNLLTNPKFADGFTGWTNSDGGSVTGNIGYSCVEVYEKAVDVQQTVKAKPGLYSISVKAFERPAGNGSYDGSEEPLVYLFMNDFRTPVQNICADAIAPEEAVSKTNCFLDDSGNATGSWPYDYTLASGDATGKYVPNSMEGAHYAFSADRYVQKCYGLVGEDSIMTIGLTSDGEKGSGQHWVLWAEFTLIYEGMNADALRSVIAHVTATYESYIEKNMEYINSLEAATADAVIDAVNSIVEDVEASSEDLYGTLVNLNKSQTATQANVAAMKALKTAIEEVEDAANIYNQTATAEALEAYSDLTSKITDSAIDNLTTDEMIALTEEVKDVTEALKIPNTSDASDDNPVDMTSAIANADIEQGATVGWTYTKNGGNGPALDSGISGKSIEFWNGTPSNLQFDIYQELTKLPAGTYQLQADAANSLNSELGSKDNIGRAFLYAAVYTPDLDGTANADTIIGSTQVEVREEEATKSYANYTVTFTIQEGQYVRIGFKTAGTMAARWFVADNFALWCFGTESTKEVSDNPMSVEALEAAEGSAIVAIYTAAGTPVAELKKGVNIVKYANGDVKKIFVK